MLSSKIILVVEVAGGGRAAVVSVGVYARLSNLLIVR